MKKAKIIFGATIITSLFLLSCNSMPEDLKNRKDYINSTLTEIEVRADKAKEMSDYKTIIGDYLSLKDSVINYTNDCNKRGIKKNNDETITTIDNSVNRIKEIIKEKRNTLHIGTWAYSGGGINYQIKIRSGGKWSSEGFQGYNSGAWSGDASNVEIYDQGILTSRGVVSEDGSILYLQTAAGQLDLKKID